MEYVSVEAIATEIKRKFRMELDIHDIIANSADVLKKMGMAALNKRTQVYLVDNYCVKLGPETYKVDSVTQLEPYVYPTEIVEQDIYFPPQLVPENPVIISSEEDMVESNGEYGDPKPNYLGQVKGIYTDFVWDCPYVKLNYTNYLVAIRTIELSKDAEGLPLIPEEALNACVYYNVYSEMEPAYLAGKIPDYTFARVEQWKDKHINQSKSRRMFKRLSANEMDKIFDIMASMDRKRTILDS